MHLGLASKNKTLLLICSISLRKQHILCGYLFKVIAILSTFLSGIWASTSCLPLFWYDLFIDTFASPSSPCRRFAWFASSAFLQEQPPNHSTALSAGLCGASARECEGVTWFKMMPACWLVGCVSVSASGPAANRLLPTRVGKRDGTPQWYIWIWLFALSCCTLAPHICLEMSDDL